MPITGYEALQQEFEQSLLQLAQQKTSALGPYVSNGGTHALQKRYNNLAQVTAVQKVQRHAPTPETPSVLSSRWTVQQMWELNDWIDRFDDVRSIVTDLSGDFLSNFVNALNRVEDAVVLTALGGTVQTGQTGTGTATLPAAQKITIADHSFDPDAGTSNSSLTVYKLQNAKKKIAGSMGNIDGLVEVALGWNQLMSLASDARFASWFYNDKRPLETGNFTGIWMGMRFHTYQDSLVKVDGSSNELVYMWIDRAIRLDFAEKLFSRITEDKDHSYDTQVYASTMLGAGRRDDALVAEIACNPTYTP